MLELRHIQKAYGAHVVLEDIDLAIQDGQIVSILGSSGCGKTTLLNVLLGITDVTHGHTRWRSSCSTRCSARCRTSNRARSSRW